MKASAAVVSRLLGKRFERSTSERSMIRGLPSRYRGFVVNRRGDSSSFVDYERGQYCHTNETKLRRLNELGRYFRVLVEHYDVEILHSPYGDIKGLLVTEKEAS